MNMGLEDRDIDRFLNLIDLVKRCPKVNLGQNTAQKKKLIMRFIEGTLKGQEISLDPEEMPIIFGKGDPNQEVGQKNGFRKISGAKICS